MNEKTSGSQDPEKQLLSTAKSVASKATGAIDSARSSAHGAVDNVADHASAAIDWTTARINSATEAPNRYLDAGAEYIRERPYVAVGVALAVGYVIGRLRS
jgi:ElaB/YqjD/DUF883 family membrane-anchored ribosome-binding protein